MSSRSDTNLMLDVKAGDIKKLGILFERYKTVLFSYLFRITQNKHTSEDLVQNVFMRILKYRKNFTGCGKFTNWMYKIAHNVSVDHFNKDNRYRATDDFSKYNLKDNQTGDEVLIQKEQVKLLEKALYQLSEKKREILVLSKYQKLKYKDISKILGCSEATVKVRVFRAIMDLKDKYTRLEEL